MKKTDVYVVVDTPKKAKKLKKLLDAFKEDIYYKTNVGLSTGVDYNGSKQFGFPYIFIDENKEWCGYYDKPSDKTKVSIKELRNILAKEHLKAGDVVFMRSFNGEYESVLKIKGVKDEYLKVDKQLFVTGSDSIYTDGQELIKDFIRYATEEEKALLEPIDKFAELKDAHRNGAVIQWRREKFGNLIWQDCNGNEPAWANLNEYRIKPEEKPTLTDSDIAIVERLHDTLLDNHGYSLESKLLTDARMLADKIKSNIK